MNQPNSEPSEQARKCAEELHSVFGGMGYCSITPHAIKEKTKFIQRHMDAYATEREKELIEAWKQGRISNCCCYPVKCMENKHSPNGPITGTYYVCSHCDKCCDFYDNERTT
jgi:hypothetical protein